MNARHSQSGPQGPGNQGRGGQSSRSMRDDERGYRQPGRDERHHASDDGNDYGQGNRRYEGEDQSGRNWRGGPPSRSLQHGGGGYAEWEQDSQGDDQGYGPSGGRMGGPEQGRFAGGQRGYSPQRYSGAGEFQGGRGGQQGSRFEGGPGNQGTQGYPGHAQGGGGYLGGSDFDRDYPGSQGYGGGSEFGDDDNARDYGGGGQFSRGDGRQDRDWGGGQARGMGGSFGGMGGEVDFGGRRGEQDAYRSNRGPGQSGFQGNGSPGAQSVRGAASFRGKGPKGYTRSDERVKEDVSERLTDDEHIDASELTVEVKNGVVTLSGRVDDRRMKHHAELLAERCSGVKDIDNRIQVQRRESTQDGGRGPVSQAAAGGQGESHGGSGSQAAGSNTGSSAQAGGDQSKRKT